MNHRFDPQASLVVVPARLWGRSGSTVVRLALDTGATWTVVTPHLLELVGYDISASRERFRIVTAGGVHSVPRLTVAQISALGHMRSDYRVLCHPLPAATGVDGLLGLDFFRELRLLIDFRAGEISVE